MMSSFMLLSVFALLSLPVSSLGATEGLSAAEVALFNNSYSHGGVVNITDSGDGYYVFESNGLPDHEMQQLSKLTATAQTFQYYFDKEIEFACTPGNLPKGVIAFTKTGVAIYNPLNSNNENAVEGDTAETFDDCNGHTNGQNIYHYHQAPGHEDCGITYTQEYDQFIGVAIDGFPIYGPYASDKGEVPLNQTDLDICHGRMVDGKYRYHLTFDFPYVLGCYWGAGAVDNNAKVSYDCNLENGTDLTDWGYLCCNVEVRKVAPEICSEYPGTMEVTTGDDTTQAPTTQAPARRRRIQRPNTRNMRPNTRQNKPKPAREAYLKRWLRQLLKETK